MGCVIVSLKHTRTTFLKSWQLNLTLRWEKKQRENV